MDDDKKELEAPQHEQKSDGSLSHSTDEKGRQYRSEAVSDRNRMFHSVRSRHGNVRQNVEVNVRVEQPATDCATSCFASLAKCLKR